jgi:hypothetical protein
MDNDIRLSSTLDLTIRRTFPDINLSDNNQIKAKLKELQTLSHALKRKLEENEIVMKDNHEMSSRELVFIEENIPIGSENNKAEKRKKYTITKDQRQWSMSYDDFKALTTQSQDMYLMTLIDEIQESNTEIGFRTKWQGSKRSIEKYYHVGHERLDRITKSVWQQVQSLDSNQVKTFVNNVPHKHGNTGRKPVHTLGSDFIEMLKQFIAELDIEPLPVNFIANKPDCLLLPCGTTLLSLYTGFCQFLFERNLELDCSYSVFCQKIKDCCPNVHIAEKLGDVCNFCAMSRLMLRGISQNNLSLTERKVMYNLKVHMEDSKKRRQIYFFDRNISKHGQTQASKDELLNIIENKFKASPFIDNKSLTLEKSHLLYVITFDFKQSITIPKDVNFQASNYFYNSKRNCNVFGVCREFDNDFDIYIYDEVSGSKTADEILTMLTNSLTRICFTKEHNFIWYMDNCSGQNKNRYTVGYALYLVQALKICSSIRLKFLVVGHTHNNVDRAFAYLERSFCKREIHHPMDAINQAKKVKGMNVFLIEEFMEYRKTLESLFTSVKGIKNVAEICIQQFDDFGVIRMSNSMSNASIFPSISNYELKTNILQKDCTLQKVIDKFSNLNIAGKQELTYKKKQALKDYYLKGTVRKELFEYYGFCDDTLWSSHHQ